MTNSSTKSRGNKGNNMPEQRINNVESFISRHSEKAFYLVISAIMGLCTLYIKGISDNLKENNVEIVQLKIETKDLSGRISSLDRWRTVVDEKDKGIEKRLSTIEKQNERHELQLKGK